jgi:hypothetical protein
LTLASTDRLTRTRRLRFRRSGKNTAACGADRDSTRRALTIGIDDTTGIHGRHDVERVTCALAVCRTVEIAAFFKTASAKSASAKSANAGSEFLTYGFKNCERKICERKICERKICERKICGGRFYNITRILPTPTFMLMASSVQRKSTCAVVVCAHVRLCV